MTRFLSDSERRTLTSVCETLVPAIDNSVAPASLASLSAKDVDLAAKVEEAIPEIASPAEIRQLRLFLRLLGSPIVNGLLSGKWSAFHNLEAGARTKVLRDWMNSRFNLRRAAFQAVKRLSLFLFYASTDDAGRNPTWPAVGYQAPPATGPQDGRQESLAGHEPQSGLSTEVLVIGSGAGGSVVAARLAEAGHEVLIVEKGGDESPDQVRGLEMAGNAMLYERRGGLTTADLGMVVLAGSTLGGGTVVNWSTSLPAPDVVRHQWAREYGFDGVDGAEFDQATSRVLQALHIDTDESEANAHNQVLVRGAQALDYQADTIPRNVDGCVDCTYCGFGCRYGAKQSTRRNYLVRAKERGARILVRAEVERVLTKDGRVVGAEVKLGEAGAEKTLEVKAKAVVVSAGAVHTPAVLKRSGLRHPELGANLRLHPVTAPVGVFEEPIRSWYGPPQTRVISDLADLEDGHGVRLEVAPAHPGLWASALQWTSGRQHKEWMAQVDHMANVIVLTRDRGSGRVDLDDQGRPVLHYQLDPFDAGNLMRGAEAAMRVLEAAGALKIISPHNNPMVYDKSTPGGFEDFIQKVGGRPLGPNVIGLFSAHQMGSSRIAGDEKDGVVRPDGETWEVRNLFVADASVFPTASGVNPMVTIMACAELLSDRIAERISQ